MNIHFWYAFAASLVACLFTVVGILAISRYERWARKQIGYLTSFAAGVLISVAFLHVIPEAIQMNTQAPFFILVGYFAIYLFNRFITAYVCERDEQSYDCDPHIHAHHHPPEKANAAFGLTPMMGIACHAFLDGMIYSITFQVSVLTGLLAVSGLILHKFPEGIITYLLLLHGGIEKKKAIRFSILASGLTTPVGMLLSYPAIFQMSQNTLGALLAASGGMLIYIGASHLLPETEKHNSKYSFLALGAGFLTAVITLVLEH